MTINMVDLKQTNCESVTIQTRITLEGKRAKLKTGRVVEEQEVLPEVLEKVKCDKRTY